MLLQNKRYLFIKSIVLPSFMSVPNTQLPQRERLGTAHAPGFLVAGRRETISTIGGHNSNPPSSFCNWLMCSRHAAFMARIGYPPCHSTENNTTVAACFVDIR